MKLVLTFNVVGAGSVSLAKARSLPQWFQTAAENGRQTRYRRLEREKQGGRDGSTEHGKPSLFGIDAEAKLCGL